MAVRSPHPVLGTEVPIPISMSPSYTPKGGCLPCSPRLISSETSHLSSKNSFRRCTHHTNVRGADPIEDNLILRTFPVFAKCVYQLHLLLAIRGTPTVDKPAAPSPSDNPLIQAAPLFFGSASHIVEDSWSSALTAFQGELHPVLSDSTNGLLSKNKHWVALSSAP